MNILNNIELRIVEKQKQFHKISLKRQNRIEKITNLKITKNSYAQTDDFTKIKKKSNKDFEIIYEKIYSDKNIQCSIGYDNTIIDNTIIDNNIYLKKLFEIIADIQIIKVDTSEKNFKNKYLYKINPLLFDINSNFNDVFNLVFFNDYEMLLQIDIVIDTKSSKSLILYNQKRIIIGKYTINLKLNQKINVRIDKNKLYFNNNNIFNFKNDIKFFYSSSNNFIINYQ